MWKLSFPECSAALGFHSPSTVRRDLGRNPGWQCVAGIVELLAFFYPGYQAQDGVFSWVTGAFGTLQCTGDSPFLPSVCWITLTQVQSAMETPFVSIACCMCNIWYVTFTEYLLCAPHDFKHSLYLDVYVRSFLYLLYTLIKLYYTKALSIKPRLWPWIEFFSSGGQESRCLHVIQQPPFILGAHPGSFRTR